MLDGFFLHFRIESAILGHRRQYHLIVGAERGAIYRRDSLALRAKVKSKTRSGGTGCASLTR
jgi:hypothetical protein